jgi:hypothetical protein
MPVPLPTVFVVKKGSKIRCLTEFSLECLGHCPQSEWPPDPGPPVCVWILMVLGRLLNDFT